MESYQSKIVAFVLNVNNKCLAKKEIIEFLKYFEADDKSYVYNKDKQICLKRGKIVSFISSYDFNNKLTLLDLVKDSALILSNELYLERHLYLITEWSVDEQIDRINQFISKHNINLHVFNLKEGLNQELNKVYFKGLADEHRRINTTNESEKGPDEEIPFFPFSS